MVALRAIKEARDLFRDKDNRGHLKKYDRAR